MYGATTEAHTRTVIVTQREESLTQHVVQTDL